MPTAFHTPSALGRFGASVAWPQAPGVRVSHPAQVRPTTTWLERLAVWAEAQPPHRRLGSWQQRGF